MNDEYGKGMKPEDWTCDTNAQADLKCGECGCLIPVDSPFFCENKDAKRTICEDCVTLVINSREDYIKDLVAEVKRLKDDYEGPVRTCRVCGCTDTNCSQCFNKTGELCHWVEDDLCSACVGEEATHA